MDSTTLIIRASQFAAEKHAGQNRKYVDRPFIEHPQRVAQRLMALPVATGEMVAAAYMHDVIEDCGVEPFALEAKFGPGVAKLVVELTNVASTKTDLPRAQRKKIDRERLSKCSIQARLIKCLDRIDNLTDLHAVAAGLTGADREWANTYVAESRALAKALEEPTGGVEGVVIRTYRAIHQELTELADRKLPSMGKAPQAKGAKIEEQDDTDPPAGKETADVTGATAAA